MKKRKRKKQPSLPFFGVSTILKTAQVKTVRVEGMGTGSLQTVSLVSRPITRNPDRLHLPNKLSKFLKFLERKF